MSGGMRKKRGALVQRELKCEMESGDPDAVPIVGLPGAARCARPPDALRGRDSIKLNC